MTGSPDWSAECQRLALGHRHDRVTPGQWDTYVDPSHPPLTETEVREAEGDLGITFPDAYRDHLLRVSRGAGFRPLWRGPRGWVWYGDDDTNYHLLTEPFPHPDSYAAYDAELGDREPPREDAGAWRAWDDECGVLEERKTAGAVYLQEGGRGCSPLLVVTGPHRGEMWFDARATCDRILPLSVNGRPAAFADWRDRGFRLSPS
ncbi:SMI1/KNR4 family protein [Streptomyces sp. NPDC048623]|uniref:SMI1/KNR4 family protein n=1 Tax=Streptomyces sp. NPDC048623 TaxID=3155761 RepID=UPI00342D12C3